MRGRGLLLLRASDGRQCSRAGARAAQAIRRETPLQLFRRLKTFKASQLKGTSHLSTPAVNCICKRYRWCVTANKGYPERARRQILNMVEHYSGNHEHCRDFEEVNEAGEPIIWCGFHREGPEYKFRYLPRGKPLQQYHARVTKKKTESGVEEETEEIDVKAGILDVLNVFLSNDKLAAATSGKNSNVNESLPQLHHPHARRQADLPWTSRALRGGDARG